MFSFFETLVGFFQWILNFFNSAISSVRLIYNLVTQGTSWITTMLFNVIPAWMIPFFLAVFAYWIIMFVLHLGGDK